MMDTNQKQGLSVLAEFDDLTRYINNVFGGSNIFFQEFIEVLRKSEEFRLKCQEYEKKISLQNNEIQNLKRSNVEFARKLAATRKAFARQACAKEAAIKDYKEIQQKVKLVQNLLSETPHRDGNELYSVLSSINLNAEHLSRANYGMGQPSAYNQDESEDSIDLLFDKSDDNLEPDLAEIEPTCFNINKTQRCSTIQEAMEVNVLNTGFSKGDEGNESPDTDTLPMKSYPHFSSNMPNKVVTCANLKSTLQDTTACNRLSMDAGLNRIDDKSFKRTNSKRNYLNNIYTKTMSGKIFKLEPERLTTKPHEFSEKMGFTQLTCVPCGRSIGFCNKYLICGQCRGVSHVRCSENLTRPCVPKFACSTVGLRKMIYGANVPDIIKIADFTDSKVRPWVPPLLIHCCNEVDRRVEGVLKMPSTDSSLHGLYQHWAPEKEVRELKKKILEAKTGIPLLTNENITTLCDVIKSFLRSLDDPVVTKILFSDFVRAAQHVENEVKQILTGTDKQSDYSSDDEVDHLDSMMVLKGVIFQLPLPNRDSLAFLFMHFKRIIEAKIVTKMDSESLALAFGPILVGSSSTSMIGGVDKSAQVTVVNALMRISTSFWNSLLNDPTFNPFKDEVKTNKLPKSVSTRGVLDTSMESSSNAKNDSFY